LLQQALPEVNPQQQPAHFTIDDSADILKVDAQLLLDAAANSKSNETDLKSGTTSSNHNRTKQAAAARRTATPNFPGFRSKTAASVQQRGRPQPKKSSMFLPARKPTALAAATKPTLHTRKKGAAQALVGKGRVIRPQSQQQSQPQGGAAGIRKLGGARRTAGKSRMKLLDVAQVQELTVASTKTTASTSTTAASNNKHKPLRKRKLETSKPTADAVAQPTRKKTAVDAADTMKPSSGNGPNPGEVSTTIPNTTTDSTTTNTANALASAALSAYQAQIMAAAPAAAPVAAPAPTAAPAQHAAHKQQDWRQMLQEKSNKLSQDDRFRIQQFFVDRFNPTPHQPTYKMKLHEERMTDPNTQQPVKETYYLELDYTNFTSRQSKKVKRY
jgi:hypothetical protein